MEGLSLTAGVDLGEGSNSTFSEHGHVAYQIKKNHKGSNYVAIILPARPPPDPGYEVSRSKIQLFQNMLMLHIKLMRIKNAVNMVAKILTADWPPPTPPDPGYEVSRSKFNFSRTC